jgi:hypothetical protein
VQRAGQGAHLAHLVRQHVARAGRDRMDHVAAP